MILDKIKSGLFVGSLAISIASSALLYNSYQKIGKLEQTVDLQAETITNLQDNLALQREENLAYQRQVLETTNSFNETKRRLEDLKGREKTVLAKKSLVALRINKAFQKRQREMACLTGDKTACSKD